MKKIIILTLTILSMGKVAFGACGYHAPELIQRERSSVAIPGETKDWKKLATISKKEAKKIATEKYPGKVKEASLINDDGTLVWKLEVKGEQGQKEVFVDPATGTFLGYGLTK